MRYVLDATAIRNGMTLSGEYEWYMTSSVKDEISRGKQAKDLNLLVDISIKIMDPSTPNVERIEAKARETGDIGRLSKTDIEVLALALEIDGIILSDDYSVQNIAKALDIKFKGGAEKGIKEVFTWRWRCRGCGKFYDEEMPDCPICGSELRSVRKRSKQML